MFSSLPDLQKERGFPHPSRKKKLLKSKRESTRYIQNQKESPQEKNPENSPLVRWHRPLLRAEAYCFDDELVQSLARLAHGATPAEAQLPADPSFTPDPTNGASPIAATPSATSLATNAAATTCPCSKLVKLPTAIVSNAERDT